eukprot:3936812-Rhodomonas_salina.1
MAATKENDRYANPDNFDSDLCGCATHDSSQCCIDFFVPCYAYAQTEVRVDEKLKDTKPGITCPVLCGSPEAGYFLCFWVFAETAFSACIAQISTKGVRKMIGQNEETVESHG